MSLEPVDYKDIPEIDRSYIHRQRRKTLKLSFSSKTDLLEFSYKHEFHIFDRTFLDCKTRSGDSDLNGASNLDTNIDNASSMYWAGTDVTSYPLPSITPTSINNGHDDQPIIYYTYFFVSGQAPAYGNNPPPPAYDLERHPIDICFQVSGGNMLGMYFISNTLIIPKETISAALAKGQPR